MDRTIGYKLKDINDQTLTFWSGTIEGPTEVFYFLFRLILKEEFTNWIYNVGNSILWSHL
jgi:hypothetical protein